MKPHIKKTNTPLGVSGKVVLSVDGEDLFIRASSDRITISSATTLTGLRTLIGLSTCRPLRKRADALHAAAKQLGWTMYAKFGCFKIAILGVRRKKRLQRILYRLMQARLAETAE